jgi:hemerythrin-like domain-containing protein
LLIAAVSATGLSGMVASCKDQNTGKAKKPEDEKHQGEELVSANEDLMREHGLLQLMMLVYDTAMLRIGNKQGFNPDYIHQTATIVRNFVEDYHEKLEEDYLFPRLEEANKLTNLTATLRKQHQAGRKVTDKLLELTKNGRTLKGDEPNQTITLMEAFNTMYRPHESREDTVLFPAFKEVVSTHEYAALGEEFEKREHEKFGDGGFDGMVDKVAKIEKQIGIYELSQFTPQV